MYSKAIFNCFTKFIIVTSVFPTLKDINIYIFFIARSGRTRLVGRFEQWRVNHILSYSPGSRFDLMWYTHAIEKIIFVGPKSSRPGSGFPGTVLSVIGTHAQRET